MEIYFLINTVFLKVPAHIPTQVPSYVIQYSETQTLGAGLITFAFTI